MDRILVLSGDTDRDERFASLVQSVFPDVAVHILSDEEPDEKRGCEVGANQSCQRPHEVKGGGYGKGPGSR